MNKIIALAFLICSGAQAQTDPPLVTTPAWFTWYENLLSQRISEVPLERPVTYHFSQAGDDTAGDGSIANPWKSLAKADEVLDAAEPLGGVAVLFKRGEVWHETAGIDTSTPNVTVADYGAGDKPLLTAFLSVGDPALWSPTAGHPNVYERPAPARVTWAKQDNDLDRPWSRQKTVAGVNATEGSWCWRKGVLYVHPRHVGGVPTDPRVDGLEYEAVCDAMSPGVRVRGDGSRVENIRAQGWGITVELGSQMHGIDSMINGTGRGVFVGCESHYGLSHVMTHAAGQGGIVTFVDCKAGLTTFSANGGETMFNTFALNGGNQTIYHQCEATHGTLPSDDFAPNRRNGWAFYGHTNGFAKMGLTISYGCTTRDTRWGCKSSGGFGDVPTASQLSDVRCFLVGETFLGTDGAGEEWPLGPSNTARVNGRFRLRPAYVGWEALAWQAAGWMINCTVELDLANQPPVFSFFRSQLGWPSDLRIWNSYIGVKTAPGQVFRWDWSVPPVQQTMSVRNSVLVHTGGGTCALNASVLNANAYYGYGATPDPAGVMLSSVPPAASIACGSALACRGGPLPEVIEYDQTGAAGHRNDIGPVEVFVCANCDGSVGSPTLSANDFVCFLNNYAAGNAAANCDGSSGLTANDFTCFLNLYATNCP